jgi:hypothetical protein
MRSSKLRHLGSLAPSSKGAIPLRGALRTLTALAGTAPHEHEFAPRDYLAFLLHIDAEIEHGLMVQYLYAAYSLGGPQVPDAKRDLVRAWQQTILGIAKEEMGHLMTVQNVLRLIGAPLNLGRDDYPWDVPFYPFPFALEPLTLDSLAKYIYAESPQNLTGPLADEIREIVARFTPSPHRVSELFDAMIGLTKDSSLLPDTVFQPDTCPFQASFDEWGRGYANGNRGNLPDPHGSNTSGTPNVIVLPLASRDNAVAALQQIADQGESPPSQSMSEPSHFARFVTIYTQMKECAREGWEPTRPVATNPYISLDSGIDPARGLNQRVDTNLISDPQARLWASLHNLRYRMLLSYLTHSFTLNGGLSAAGAHSPRGAIVNATFGEMYNLRAVAEILMQLPLGGDANPRLCAGPPFQMPYTLDSPLGEPNRWRVHVDLLLAARELIGTLLQVAPDYRHVLLRTMRDADNRMMETAEAILSRAVNLALA